MRGISRGVYTKKQLGAFSDLELDLGQRRTEKARCGVGGDRELDLQHRAFQITAFEAQLGLAVVDERLR